MAKRMVEAGHEVHMITSKRELCQQEDAGNWIVSDIEGITVHWYPVQYSNHMTFSQRIMAFIKFALAAKNKAMDLPADVIFATSTPLTIAIPAVPAARKKKVPLVFEVRDLWPEMPIAVGALKNPLLRFLSKRLEKWTYKNSDAIVALSPGMKDGVIRCGYPQERVGVIPNSSDNKEFQYDEAAGLEFRKSRSWLKDKPLLVYTGTLGRVNDVNYLVDLSIELLKLDSKIRILVVGDGAEKEKIIENARRAGVYENNLFFENPIPKQEIPALLSAATVAAVLFADIPEMRVNSANKFFDALASSTPVLINFAGWMDEIVAQNDCGMAMWGRTIDTVALELNSKVSDPEWLSEAGGASRALAERYFDRDELAKKLIQVIETSCEGDFGAVSALAPGKYCDFK